LKQSVEDLAMMRRSILDTVAIMDRFLHAERLRRGKMPVRPAETDARNTLEQIAKLLQYQLKDRNSTIEIDAPDDLKITTDPVVLTIILQNLLGNAIKYGGDDRIKMSAAPTAGGAVRISVIDHGPGVPPEKVAELFAPFARGETYGQKGLGLGLWIVRHSADLLKGKLWVESTPGHGATFHLELPAV
ncbi:MAG: sensor histidine kinase, partial [Tepidisphaeraceae bacterium]